MNWETLERGACETRRSILSGVSPFTIVAAFVSTPAFAQTVTPQSQPSQAATDQDTNATQGKAAGAIVVTGRRAALKAATERKRRSETIIDSVVAEDAGKLPDNSITEVLQRVAGVSIVRFAALNDPDHFSVEGSGIQVRGLSGVASRLNGREVFSANNGRSLLWGDVTPEMMAAVDVYKDATADLIEGGTGGQVDLRTKLPFDFKGGLHFAASGEISRGDFAKKNDPSVSGLITDSWQTPLGKIGVLVDLSYSKLSTNSQFFRMEPYFKTHINGSDYFIPGGYDYGEDDYQRKRTGIYGALQWAPSDSLRLTGIFFQSRYKSQTVGWGEFVTSQNLAVDPTQSQFDSIGGLLSSPNVFLRDSNTFLPSGNPIAAGGNSAFVTDNSKTRDYSLAFQFTPASSPLALSGSIQRVESTASSDGENIFPGVNFPTSFGIDLTGRFPKVTIPQSGLSGFSDPANYQWQADMPHDSNNKGALNSAQLDAEYKFDNSFFKSVKIGGRLAKRTERDLDNGYNWVALGRGWNGSSSIYAPQLTFANAAPGDIEGHIFNNFFHGGLAVPTNLLFPSISLDQRSILAGRNQLHAALPSTPIVLFPGTSQEEHTLTGFCGPFTWNGNVPTNYFNCAPAGPIAQTGYGGTGIRAPGFVLPQDQTNDETIDKAVYAEVRFAQENWLNFAGNVGARLVRVKNQSAGYFQQGANGPFIYQGQTISIPEVDYVRSGGASFTRLLPDVNLQVGPSPTTKIRFAYNITMDLPTFYALRASGGLGVVTTSNPNNPPSPLPQLPGIFSHFTTSSGNPLLKPTMSDNFDLSFEWYPKGGALLHLALFHKHITNLPIYADTQQPVTVQFADGSTQNVTATSTDYRNATEPATVKGFEVGGRTFFDKLPGLLRGFGVEANYTYIQSKNPGDLYHDINGVAHNDAPLAGLSTHNFNATLMYELKGISARIAYSWRSKYLQSTNSNGTNPTYSFFSGPGESVSTPIALPVYGDAYGQVDAGLRVKVNEHLQLSLQGTNLTNATQRTLMGGYPGQKLYVRSWFQSDRRVSVGANVAF